MVYHPVQVINLAGNGESAGYREYLPILPLQQYVICYWFFRRGGMEGEVLVNPDCCADIIFNLDARSIGEFSELTGSFAERFYVDGTGLNSCGIRLKPGIMYHLIREGIDSLTNTSVCAADYPLLNVEEIASRIIGKSDLEIVNFFNSFLTGIFKRIDFIESKYNYSVKIFDAIYTDGNEDLFVSEKTADRYFMKYFGLTRKRISSVMRFQRSLHHLLSFGNILPEGYYDQSHFIKEFKRCCGLTPLEFINLTRPLPPF